MEHEIKSDPNNSSNEEFHEFPYYLIETKTLSDERLCSFLSDIFLDTEVDYKSIAWFARHFPLEHVEKVLFEWVAPVCYVNLMSVIPEVWFSFDPDELWQDIQKKREEEKSPNIFERLRIAIRNKYIRNRFDGSWKRLQSEIKKLNNEMPLKNPSDIEKKA